MRGWRRGKASGSFIFRLQLIKGEGKARETEALKGSLLHL